MMSERFTPGIKGAVIKAMGTYFDAISAIMIMYTGRLHIEIIHGEMTDFMEHLRHDALEHRFVGPTQEHAVDPRTLPKTYDFIHLSNIP